MTDNNTTKDEAAPTHGGSDSATKESKRVPQQQKTRKTSEETSEPDKDSIHKREKDGRNRTTERTDLSDGKSVVQDPRYVTMPTIRPTLVVLSAVLIVGIAAIGAIAANPDLLGGAEVSEIVIYTVGILVAVISVRLIIKMIVLSRTEYTIRDNAFQRDYDLLYRSQSREVPVEKLRGHEYSRGRIQSLLGFGTVRLLTAGTSRSIGFIEFEHLNDPERVREEIRAVAESEKIE